jgi:caa(3)-type oxidase subunit IV
MATDDKDDVRDNGADATENKAGEDAGAGAGAGATETAGEGVSATASEGVSATETASAGETSAEKHEGERSAAEEHLAKKERTEKAFGASTSGDKLEKEPVHAHGPAAGAHAVKHHAPNRKEYMVIFLVLFVLTVLEVAVAQVPGISKTLLALALVSLAIAKAAFVGLYYMHLKHETNVLKLTVAIPLATPAVYAIVLIAEAAWRLTRQ